MYSNLFLRRSALAFSLTSLFAGWMLIATPQAEAQWSGDIDDISQELDRDFKFGGKEEIKAENLRNANEQVREDTQIENKENNTLSPLSGTYTVGSFTFSYDIYASGKFVGKGTSLGQPTVSISIIGTVINNRSSFKLTRTETTGPPTNFLAPCSESTSVTGVFTGAGEAGTTHAFTRNALCSEIGPTLNPHFVKQ